MGEDFRSAPVPIRLTCRYANGIVVGYGARALAYDDSAVQVLSAENFEKGVSLSVLAPFWDGITSCRVARTFRSREQPAYFELELRFLTKPVPIGVRGKKEVTAEPAEPEVPEEVGAAAAELALLLERAIGRRFSEVWKEFAEARRPLFLLATTAAVLLLLQEKGFLDLRHVLLGVQEAQTG